MRMPVALEAEDTLARIGEVLAEWADVRATALPLTGAHAPASASEVTR